MELSGYAKGKSSAELRERIEKARDFQKKHFENIPNINCNAQMTPSLVKEFCKFEVEGVKLLKLAHEKYDYSARTYHKYANN